MLSNLVFCLNATVPIFLLMLLGMFFMRVGIFTDDFVRRINSFVFRIALPVLVFYDLCREDFFKVWDLRYVLYCFFSTAAMILLVTGISFLLKNKAHQGEFIQVSYRSSAAILGVTLVVNIYGDSGMTPLMILGVVPLYNIAAVVALSLFQPDRKPLDRERLKKTAREIVTNPIILGVFAGLIWSLLQIPMPSVLDKTVESVARLATPLGIMAMGAAFDLKKALASWREASLSTFLKLFGLCCIFLPIGIAMGFTQDKLVAALIMCGSPTTVSCYVMAREMGHDGTLTSSTVMLTTFLSSFSLTFWLFILKSMGLL